MHKDCKLNLQRLSDFEISFSFFSCSPLLQMIFLNINDAYQVKYKKERNIKYFREKFTYNDGGFATLDWYIPEICFSGKEPSR